MDSRLGIVGINKHITTVCLVIFIHKPIFESIHQLSSDIQPVSLKSPVHTKPTYQHGRIAAMAFGLWNFSLERIP